MFATRQRNTINDKKGMIIIRKHIIFQLFSTFLFILAITNLIVISSNAYSISEFLTDSSTRWKRYGSDELTHMGSTYTTYTYSSTDCRNQYETYVTAGISLWGSCISCSENEYSTIGMITSSDDYVFKNAETVPVYVPSTRHVVSWTITIYSLNFDINTEDIKIRTIAHEIGHVYGLDHVNYNNQIMYGSSSSSKNVTSYDIAGMDVMTHSHMHTGPYSTTLEQHSAYTHKARCTTCHAYHFANCSYTDYHSGMKHYLLVDCSCGNQHTESWACTGNPCVLPFINSTNHEIE